MKNSKTKIVFIIMLLMLVLVPAVSAQENDYGITANKAFEHANAHMISFIAGNAPGFENWKGASIDLNPLELYDISGQKLFYRFSVYKSNELIGTIDVCADKTLGPSIYDIIFNPKPYKTTEALKKAKEIAKNRYPAGEIKSTVMTVYSYPRVGAMTVVKEKTTGVEHRIFVDGYTLDEVQDKPVTEKEVGVWSMYDQILKYGKENNLKEWQKSDKFTNSIEQAAANKGITINMAVTEENIEKLNADVAVSAATTKTLSVPVYKQENSYYCVPASIRMLCTYFNKPTPIPSQTSIYTYLKGKPPYGLGYDDITTWVRNQWGKTPTVRTSAFYNSDVVTEIDNGRPFFSLIPGHCRICRGYQNQGGSDYFAMNINDPLTGKSTNERTYGNTEIGRVYVR